MQPFVVKFLKDNLSAVEAARTVLPVWKHLVFHPRLFLAELAGASRLSLKNAASFTLSSATLLAATVLAIVAPSTIYFYFFKPGGNSQTLPAFAPALIEMGFLIFFFIGAIGLASVVYLAALCALHRCSFKRLFVASLYVGTFLNTVHVLMMFVLAGLVVLFGTHQQFFLLLKSQKDAFAFLKMELHPVVTAWVGVMQVWANVVGLVLSMVMQTRITGLGVFRLLSGLVILLAVLVAITLSVWHARTLLYNPVSKPVPIRAEAGLHHVTLAVQLTRSVLPLWQLGLRPDASGLGQARHGQGGQDGTRAAHPCGGNHFRLWPACPLRHRLVLPCV